MSTANTHYTSLVNFYEQIGFLCSHTPDLDTALAKVWMNTRSVEYMQAGVSPNIEVSKFCRAAKKSQQELLDNI